jgi:hypothetical protein
MMAFCCRSYSLNEGISTGALREYARAIARLLWGVIKSVGQFFAI